VRVVATAGHVDHGKSSLVRALTGTDPDRFAEEKARGLTIDLGFAFTTLASGTEVGFVDVPGHVRFIKNMLAGVGAVEVALLVVAAGEGWMPQTAEHLQILDLLGIEHGLVVITKADTVGADVVELVELEVNEQLAESLLRDAPVVACDSVSCRGLDEVRDTLDAVLAAAPLPADHGRPRLWIDRVFAARGAGTVVTGTLAGGPLAVEDELEVARLGRQVRVRSIETAHRRVDHVSPGARVALNLAGIDHDLLARGDALVRAGEWSRAKQVDVALLPVVQETVGGRAPLQAYVGSGEHEVKVRPLDGGAFARLRFATALPLAPGDRLVLRDPGRAMTVAGAVVLDAEPTTKASDAPPGLTLELGPRLIAGHEWIARSDLPRLAGLGMGEARALAASMVETGSAVAAGEWLVAPDVLADLRGRAADRVRTHHLERPFDIGIELGTLATALRVDPDRVRAALVDQPELVLDRGAVRDAARTAGAAESASGRALIAELDASPFSPASPSDPVLARALVREGALVELDGIMFTIGAVDRARALIEAAFRHREALTIADARALLGSSRKYVVPLLGRFDAEGVTRRQGDARVAGPRVSAGQADPHGPG
jgi:selenocysteine-specific elongation factor